MPARFWQIFSVNLFCANAAKVNTGIFKLFPDTLLYRGKRYN